MKEEDGWTSVCIGPCHVHVLAGEIYRVARNHVVESEEFGIDERRDPVRLYAHAGSASWRTVDYMMDAAGALSMVVGFGGAISAGIDQREERLSEATPFLVAGLVLLAGGVVLVGTNGTELNFKSGTIGAEPVLALGHGLELSCDGLRF